MRAKFGVGPASIADYLALVGDSADGYPGFAGWGAKSTAAVLAKWGTIEDIPLSSGEWGLGGLRGVEKLSKAFRDNFADALLFKRIATLELDVPVGDGRRLGVGRPDRAVRGGRRRWPACPSWSSGRSALRRAAPRNVRRLR